MRLIDAGAYKEMELCLMCHPSPGPKDSSGTGPSLALTGIEVEFFGHRWVCHGDRALAMLTLIL